MKTTFTTRAIDPPPPPPARLSLGIVGHRENNVSYATNKSRVKVVLDSILDTIDKVNSTAGKTERRKPAPVRLHSLLAEGIDQLAANCAVVRQWELVAPIPFGRTLNMAINAHPASVGEAKALLTNLSPGNDELYQRAEAIRTLTDRASTFELADSDDVVSELFLNMLAFPDNAEVAAKFSAYCSARVALASRVLIEQSDIIIGVWDGESRNHVGGTGHTIAVALEMGAPVIWIDARTPEDWRILGAPESLVYSTEASEADRAESLISLVNGVLVPPKTDNPSHKARQGGIEILEQLRWRHRSNSLFHAYRRVEALFGGEPAPFRSLKQHYEPPEKISTGSAASLLNAIRGLPGVDPLIAGKIETAVLARYAWSDGVSTHYSDCYRGGMVGSFLSSGMAIVAGSAYLPFGDSESKWLFALAEFLLLVGILVVTGLGQKLRWHSHWFEARRVAEYLRHSPFLLILGVARSAGRWPKGTNTSWPEWYARLALREVGLPRVVVDQTYLRAVLNGLLDRHVVYQRDYHEAKARRLHNVHRNLDRLSEILFQLAVASVSLYLVMKLGTTLSIVPHVVYRETTMMFTFMGVLLPTFGATIAGIRYFGDFERFAAISEVTAEKLSAVHQRALILLAAPDSMLDYGSVADLAHVTDDIVVTEIENWQAVFGGKHITVPV